MKYEIGPLFLPPGSIRGLICLIVFASLPYLLLHAIEVPTFYQLLAASVAGYLFGQSNQNASKTDPQAQQDIDDVKESLSKLEAQAELQKLQLMQHGGVVVVPPENK